MGDTRTGLKRVLFLYDTADPHAVTEGRVYRDAARRLGIELVERAVQTEAEAQTALAQVQQGEVDRVLKPQTLSLNVPSFILETTAQQRLPGMFDAAVWVEWGGLASYGRTFTKLAGKQHAW